MPKQVRVTLYKVWTGVYGEYATIRYTGPVFRLSEEVKICPNCQDRLDWNNADHILHSYTYDIPGEVGTQDVCTKCHFLWWYRLNK